MGTGAVWPGSAARRAWMRAFTAATRAGLLGPRLEPPELAALSGMGLVAEGRPQKCAGSLKGWPIRREPTAWPSRQTRLPLAGAAIVAWATPVTASG
jgi:hypothetical protein